MQEHPIPQDVTGYKFHIVGNMTLKQFAEVGAGVLLAIIIYNTNLLIFIKWPLIVLAVGLGGMMAFVPIEERPLDHWIVTFFKRLYNPTKFYWRRETELPFALKPQKKTTKIVEPTFEIDLTPARTERIRQYIESVKQPTAEEPWISEEKSRVAEILNTFETVEVKSVDSQSQKIKPSLIPRIRNLLPSQKPLTHQQTVFQSENSIIKQDSMGELNKIKQPTIEQLTEEPTPLSVSKPIDTSAEKKVSEKKKPLRKKTILKNKPEKKMKNSPQANQLKPPVELQPIQPQNAVNTNASLPFPRKELAPNKIVGMVMTKDNKLVDRAVVTIKNAKGQVAGAFNTNVLGQFFVSTPFPNGTYTISVEKAGLEFPQASLSLSGEVVEPLELRAV